MEYISINVKISVEIGDFSKGYQKRNRNKSHTPPPLSKKCTAAGCEIAGRSRAHIRPARPVSRPPHGSTTDWWRVIVHVVVLTWLDKPPCLAGTRGRIFPAWKGGNVLELVWSVPPGCVL